MNYFVELSRSIAGEYATTHNTHSAYLNVVDEFMVQHEIIEYYQVDPYGSFLGFDFAGNCTWLIFSAERQILEYIDIAKNSAASSEVIRALETRNSILGLTTETLKKQPVSQWSNYLFPVKDVIVTDEKYYYSIVKDNNLGIDTKRVKPLLSYYSQQ